MRLSWIDFFQQVAEIGEAFAPEDAVVSHPVGEWRQALRLSAVIDCEIAPCVTPLPRVSSTTVISFVLATRSNTARLVGSARARMTTSMAVISVMKIH
jgi:hypothetical protein